jgi:hypothetical protein
VIWEPWKPYPLPIGEGQGLFLQKSSFTILAGFTGSFSNFTSKGFTYNVSDRSGSWKQLDDIPLATGLTHTGFTRIGENVVAMCGGYVGAHPGRATEKCLMFNISKPSGSQWVILPDIPGQRAGGGLWHDVLSNTLTFATGAVRPDPNPLHTYDRFDVWILDMANVSSGWKNTTNSPYGANHVGATTVWYRGKQRHYILGGQHGEMEAWTNQDVMFEWDVPNKLWVPRARMLEGRGHFSSSTMPYNGCGFFIAGGRLNGPITADVSYYDIGTDSWHRMGALPLALNTPICDVAGTTLYCNTGRVGNPFAWKAEILKS